MAESVEIKAVEKLTDEQHKAIFGWGEDVFELGHLKVEWRPKDYHFVVEEGGRPVGHVGVVRHTVKVGGAPVEVGGIGGVVTVPGVRGKGYAQQAMRRAADFMRGELRVPFGLLFCREQLAPFYERLGWQRLSDPVEFEQSSGRRRWPLAVMVLPLGEEAWPAGAVDLQSLPW